MKYQLIPFVLLLVTSFASGQNFNATVFLKTGNSIKEFKAIKALFGDQPNETIEGYAMMVRDSSINPLLGCEELINNVSGKIAVVSRGSCEFGKKVLNAQDKGAIAAIVIHGLTNDYPIAMGTGTYGSQVTIPSYMVEHIFWEEFRNLPLDVMVEISIQQFIESTSNTTESQLLRDVQISPNPSSDIISVSSKNQISKIKISNFGGSNILPENLSYLSDNEAIIDVSNLANGLYFIKIFESNTIITRKFIVSK